MFWRSGAGRCLCTLAVRGDVEQNTLLVILVFSGMVIWIVMLIFQSQQDAKIQSNWEQWEARERILDANKIWQDGNARTQALERRMDMAQLEVGKCMDALREHYKQEFIKTTSIQHLKEYGASGVRWGALEAAGVCTIKQIFARRHSLTSIDGVGDVSAQRILEALERCRHDWSTRTIKIPANLTTGAEKRAARAVLVHQFYTHRLAPHIQDYRELTTPPAPPTPDKLTLKRYMGEIPYPIEAYEQFMALANPKLAVLKTLEEFEQQGLGRLTADIDRAWQAYRRECAASLRARQAGGGDLDETSPMVRQIYETEAQFEMEFLEPLIDLWGMTAKQQQRIEVKLGSGSKTLIVDQLVSDEQGLVILIESKRSIVNDQQLEDAMVQARSYALQLGFPAFMVAAPQGVWLYTLTLNQEALIAHEGDLDVLVNQSTQWRERLLKHRKPVTT